MAAPFTQYNSLRIYDRMVGNWVGSLPVDYGDLSGRVQRARGLLWVYADPTKALGAMRDLLLRKGWVRPGDVGADDMTYEDWINVPLPFASVLRQDPVLDPMRSQVPFVFRKFLREGKRYRSVRHPVPYDIAYTVTYWMRRKFTDAYIREWIAVQAGPLGAGPNEFFLTADFGTLWGTKIIPMQEMAFADNSDLDPDDESDRTLRFDASFTLKAWLFPPVEPSGPDSGTPIVLRIITDVGPQSRLDETDFESVYDRIVTQNYNEVTEMLENDPVLFEVSAGVTQDGRVWDIPAGGFIQTVDIPVLESDALLVTAPMAFDTVLPSGVEIELQDYNRVPFQNFRYAYDTADEQIAPAFWVIPDEGMNGIRTRFAPSAASKLTLGDLDVRPASFHVYEETNLFPEGDMESGAVGDWLPVPPSSTLPPSAIAFDPTLFYEGTRSLKVTTTALDQGVERIFTVPEGKLFIVQLRLHGSGGMLDLGVLDDVEGSSAIESVIPVVPQARWDNYALVIRPRTDKITFRARQRTGSGTVFNLDAVTLREVEMTLIPEEYGVFESP